jgi:hypothetical protein
MALIIALSKSEATTVERFTKRLLDSRLISFKIKQMNIKLIAMVKPIINTKL